MLLSSSLLRRLTIRRFLVWGQLALTLNALPLLALGARLPVLRLVAASFVAGAGSSVSAIAWDTSLQERIPTGGLVPGLRVRRPFAYLAIPVGLLTVGPLSQGFGPYAVITVSGLLFVVIAVLPLAVPAVRELPHTAPER
ncbi:hypothetical protein [Streptomyces youssoufiensis]